MIDNLDRDCTAVMNHFFCKSLDELSERSRLSEDFESQARDQGRFVYLVCIPAAIIDRFNFTSTGGSLNGLRAALVTLVGEDTATELTAPFYMIKKLRKQYPIHEGYRICASWGLCTSSYVGTPVSGSRLATILASRTRAQKHDT